MTAEATQRILDSVDRDEMLRLAQELIRIPSFKTEESDVARFLGEYLGGRGYEVDLQEVEPGRFQTVAILRGSGGGKSLMLNGHMTLILWPWAGSATRGRPASRATSSSAGASAI